MSPKPLLLSISLSLFAGSALMAQPAHGAPVVSAYAGHTTVTLSPALLNALTALHVTPSRQFPAELRGAQARFPIPTGQIDLATAHGEIVHSGGLNLKAGNTIVTLSDFVIDATGGAPVLTGLVSVDGNLVARLPLFAVTLTQLPGVKNYGVAGKFSLDGAILSLTGDAATALNQAFGVNAFAPGLPIGSASVSARIFDPAEIR